MDVAQSFVEGDVFHICHFDVSLIMHHSHGVETCTEGTHFPTEMAPQWYSWTARWFFGNLWVENAAGTLYALAALIPVVLVAMGYDIRELATTRGPSMVLLGFWATVISIGYPVWAWFETSSFEKWVRNRPQEERTVERAYFKTIGDCTKNFWAAVVAVYAIAGLWTNVTAGESKDWASSALVASFLSADEWDNVDDRGTPLNSGHFELHYALENRSRHDYQLSANDQPKIMVKRGTDYWPEPTASLAMPIFVPAKHRVVLSLNVPFSKDIAKLQAAKTIAKTARPIQGLTTESSVFFREKLNEISDFVVFDTSKRYRIDLPRGW